MRTFRLITVMIAINICAVGIGCDPSPSPCSRTETVHLKMTGTCATETTQFDVQNLACRIDVMGMNLGLPIAGAVDQADHPIRQGGWQIFGCVDGAIEPCPGQFRRCTTNRVAWQLDMTCLDDAGNLACQSVLTE